MLDSLGRVRSCDVSVARHSFSTSSSQRMGLDYPYLTFLSVRWAIFTPTCLPFTAINVMDGAGVAGYFFKSVLSRRAFCARLPFFAFLPLFHHSYALHRFSDEPERVTWGSPGLA